MDDSARVVVLGAGALGGYLAARLALAGVDVRFRCKAQQAAALTRNGVVLRDGGQTRRVHVPVEPASSSDPIDIALLAIKSHHLAAASEQVAALARRGATLVPLCNGIPWWMSVGAGGGLASVDPRGRLGAATRNAAVIGSVVYLGVRQSTAGLTVHSRHGRLVLGAAHPAAEDRLAHVVATVSRAGLGAEPTADIRSAIWNKIWVWSPVSLACARHGLTVGQALGQSRVRADIIAMLGEVHTVATACGARLGDDGERRLAIIGHDAVDSHLPSLARDVRSGRSPELGSMVDAVVEAGRLAGHPLPTFERYRSALDA